VTADTLQRGPAQEWRAELDIDRLVIPDGLFSSTRRDLDELHRLPTEQLLLPGGIRPAKFQGEQQRDILLGAGLDPETEHRVGNLLVYGGASVQWQTLIGNGTVTAGQALTYFNNAQAAIGVGDSATAAAATQTDLQAATNKLRVAMDATYPQHTDGVVAGAASIVFRSTFSTAQANWAWNEWVVANSTTLATGRILNRKVESLGTKTSSAVWTLTITITLA
jgi:hypothetical protein